MNDTADWKRRRSGSSKLPWIVAVLGLLLLLVGFAGYRYRERLSAAFAALTESTAAVENRTAPEPRPAQPLRVDDEPGTPVDSSWSLLLGREPTWPADVDEPADCATIEADLQALCAHLDARAYLASDSGAIDSCDSVEELAERWVRSPPQLSDEVKDISRLIDNLTHLFQVTGKAEMTQLRAALREEQGLVEPMALVLYRWTASREACDPQTTIRREALATYAGYLFRSFGGQAYLRRRSPRVEALVSLYALLVLDNADRRGINPQGLDPRAEIIRTRELVAGAPLVLRDDYLDRLDRMQQRWEERARVEEAP